MISTDRFGPPSPFANVGEAAAWNGPEGESWAEVTDAADAEAVPVEPLLPSRMFSLATPTLVGDVLGILAEALRRHLGPAGVRIPGAHWLVTAMRPVGNG